MSGQRSFLTRRTPSPLPDASGEMNSIPAFSSVATMRESVVVFGSTSPRSISATVVRESTARLASSVRLQFRSPRAARICLGDTSISRKAHRRGRKRYCKRTFTCFSVFLHAISTSSPHALLESRGDTVSYVGIQRRQGGKRARDRARFEGIRREF